MSKEIIRFRGLSFNRDEQAVGNGELSLCAGVELHDGTLRPSVLEGSMVQHVESGVVADSVLLVSGTIATLLYVHETPSYKHFIAVVGNAMYWFKEDGTIGSAWNATANEYTPIHTFTNETIIKVDSVGNTLMVMTVESGIHYILWKESDYKYLGNRIPFLPIQFRPTAQYTAKYDRSTITSTATNPESDSSWRQILLPDPWYASNAFDLDQTNKIVNIKTDVQSVVTQGVLAIVNMANNTVAKDGHFYAPFIIRYCYRLYDGSMVMHSAPVFMDVALPQSIKVNLENIRTLVKRNGQEVVKGKLNFWNGLGVILDGESYGTAENAVMLRYAPNNTGIEYYTSAGTILDDLKNNWSDIVSSVDIFVSAPLLREDLGEMITQAIQQKDMYGVRDRILAKFDRVTSLSVTEPEDDDHPSPLYDDEYDGNIVFDIPMLSEEEYLQKILNTSNFYKIASYRLEDINTGWADDTYNKYHLLKYDKSVIPNITAQEEMKDDYHTHNLLLPIDANSGMYVYNHRLNLYGMKEQLFEGFSLEWMVNSTDAGFFFGYTDITDVYVEISTDDGKKYVNYHTGPITIKTYQITKALLFYPDSRATRIILKLYDGTSAVVLKMKPLNLLNGAVASEAFWEDNLNDFIQQNYTFPSVNDIISLPNRIITSEVDNPYYFPLEGRNAVGVGSVKGIAAVTRALSQGQVGDHDLVVFSTDGIWVMKVSSTGTYMTTHNISREVCSNVRSICQLDQSIVFATQRNLSKFVESDVVSISDILDGPIPKFAPAAQSMLPTLTQYFVNNTDITKLLDFGTPAVNMFNNGRVFYDYASSRIVVLQQDTSQESVALVFSIRDQAWSTMKVPGIKAIIPGYPSPYVQTVDGKVMVLDKQYDYTGSTRSGGLIITRTLTFSDTMDVLRGFRQYTDSAEMPLMFFFGSNDQRNWKPIGQTEREFYEYMPGHPFRFFRIAIYMQLLPSEEYQQLELEIINKYAKL